MAEPNPYRTAAWKAVRRAVLDRDGYRCQLRLANCKGHANAVDHIIDWRDGGAVYDMTNLRASCIPCNTAQRNRRVAARARALRSTTPRAPRTDLTW